MARTPQTTQIDDREVVDAKAEEQREESRERFIDETGRAPTPAEEPRVEEKSAPATRDADPDELDVRTREEGADRSGVNTEVDRDGSAPDDQIRSDDGGGIRADPGTGSSGSHDAIELGADGGSGGGIRADPGTGSSGSHDAIELGADGGGGTDLEADSPVSDTTSDIGSVQDAPGNGEAIDLGAETGTDVTEGAGGPMAGDAPPMDPVAVEDLETERPDAGGLGSEILGDGPGLEREVERDLGSNAGDYSSGPGEIDTGPERGLDGANAHDYPPNLRANLKIYNKEAQSGNVENAYDSASKDLEYFNRTGLDVEPADPAEHGGGGGLMDGNAGNPTNDQLTETMEEIDELGKPAETAPASTPTGQPIDQNVPLRPGLSDPSEGWGDDPNDPFDHDIGYTDPTDDVDSSTGGIPPTEAPIDTVANYEEGYLPPPDVTGDEIPQDGHLDPLINPE